jgi:hypothetical protein
MSFMIVPRTDHALDAPETRNALMAAGLAIATSTSDDDASRNLSALAIVPSMSSGAAHETCEQRQMRGDHVAHGGVPSTTLSTALSNGLALPTLHFEGADTHAMSARGTGTRCCRVCVRARACVCMRV